ncbi:hypothetical protein ACFQL0_05480 [Haloplanus litoreus]|uniref:hypothetical protein n=1 Tax=Haloplanus litoreus TaxID=767515 RepID=UPI00361A23A1
MTTLFPLYWTVNTSFKPAAETQTFPPTFTPETFTVSPYVDVLTGAGSSVLANSVIVSVGATVLAMVIGVPAGYAYARNPGKVGGNIWPSGSSRSGCSRRSHRSCRCFSCSGRSA